MPEPEPVFNSGEVYALLGIDGLTGNEEGRLLSLLRTLHIIAPLPVWGARDQPTRLYDAEAVACYGVFIARWRRFPGNNRQRRDELTFALCEGFYRYRLAGGRFNGEPGEGAALDHFILEATGARRRRRMRLSSPKA